MNTMNLTPLCLFLLIVSFAGLIQNIHAGGSGSEESDTLLINDSHYKVVLEIHPAVLDGDDSEINFNLSTINEDTVQRISNVEYVVEIYDGAENLLVEFGAYSSDENLNAIIVPSQKTSFLGEMTENGSWTGTDSSPLIINAPIFLQGGPVNVKITILSLDSEPVSGDDASFEISFTMGQFIPFSIDVDNDAFDLVFATYFDEIRQFDYDSKNKKITALMPFIWDENFIESTPFVHAEYYIPKTVDIFNNHEIVLTVNNVPYFGTVDRSGDEIVVHFLLSSSKLLKLFHDIPPEQHDKMIFGIQSGKMRDIGKKDASLNDGDKVTVLSTREDWRFHLSSSPAGVISPGNPINLNLEFRDPATNTIISEISYNVDIFLNGMLVESKRGLQAPDGRDTIKITFDKTGAVILRVFDVNNFDTSGEFSFTVEPEKDTAGDHFVDIVAGSSLLGCEGDNSCYAPFSVSVLPNQVVVWNNMDDSAHTVTSGAPDTGFSGSFDSRVIAAGETFSFEFKDKGIFDYYCTLHPWMLGTVTVDGLLPVIPVWLKDSAAWWSAGQISDSDFVTGLEYLIREDIINVQSPPSKKSPDGTIPDWLRSTAAWWADGILSDSEFLKGLEWMITNGIIDI